MSSIKFIFLFLLLLFTAGLDLAQENDREQVIRLPKTDSHYTKVAPYIPDVPDSDYRHASADAYEAFRDIKYSVRIHWGTYAMIPGIEASWPFLNMSPQEKQDYQQLYQKFNPTEFDAEEWMQLFKRCGMQAFAFTTKHHDGFSMWHTKTKVVRRVNYLAAPSNTIEKCDLHYSIEETPFKRDIVKELCDAAHKHGIKIDLYFSHIDWYDTDDRSFHYHPLITPDSILHPELHGNNGLGRLMYHTLSPNLTDGERQRFIQRHREQLKELLTNYGKIDMICFDEYLGKSLWDGVNGDGIKETVKQIRTWQPDVMLRARGIGNYGDYYQPEGWVPKNGDEPSAMPWMAILLLGNRFAFDPNGEHYKGTKWVIHNLIDCVAKGGSFMVCIGPDQTGKFHPAAIKQLEEAGDWLKVNGKGIYETQPCNTWGQDGWYFTRSKDQKRYYAFTEKWFGSNVADNVLTIPHHGTTENSVVRLLGYDKPLKWKPLQGGGLTVEIPDDLQAPCKYAWGFEITQ
jgi:alpha-L-fucosidase